MCVCVVWGKTLACLFVLFFQVESQLFLALFEDTIFNMYLILPLHISVAGVSVSLHYVDLRLYDDTRLVLHHSYNYWILIRYYKSWQSNLFLIFFLLRKKKRSRLFSMFLSQICFRIDLLNSIKSRGEFFDWKYI